MSRDHLVIFDTQIKPGTPTQHLRAIGNYIVEHRPDVLIHIGDHFDMHSLSSYDRGTKAGECARYNDDVEAGIDAMRVLLSPMYKLKRRQKRDKKKQYSPEMHFCLGNHEERIARYVNSNPTLDGKVGYGDLKLKEVGWTVHDYLSPVFVDGVQYVHFVQNRNSPNAKSSSKSSLDQTKCTTIQGHRPTLDISTGWSDSVGMLWSITCGSSYTHDEVYKKAQGNKHWRGVLHCRNVENGDFDPTFIRLETLEKEYA